MSQNILERFSTIMSSNINALLDKVEDPEKMIDQYMRDLQSDLGKVKANTAAVMAEEKRWQRMYEENTNGINKMEDYAKKALSSGNEEDARKFLAMKTQFQAKEGPLKASLEAATQNSKKMREMHDKLLADIKELEGRQNEIKSKMTLAKTQEKMNDLTAHYDSSATISAFEKMEQKANAMLDKAAAMNELNAKEDDEENDIENLMNKYDSGSKEEDKSVDDELARLKAELNLE